MPKNAADVLFEFFSQDDQGERSKYNFTSLASTLDDIRVRLATWGQIPALAADAKMFEGVPDRWLQSLFSAWNNADGLHVAGIQKPQPGDLLLLRVLSQKLDQHEPPLADAERGKVGDLVKDVISALGKDDDLPEELRLHLATLIVEVQRCLLDYDIQGDFRLSSAVERLMTALRFAETQSSKPKVWTKIYDDYFQPIMVGMMIAAPQTVMAITALTTGPTP